MKVLPSARSWRLSRGSPLAVLACAGLASLALALVPGLAILTVPFRLLLTMVHELGHGLAALLTGGEFHRFVIFPNGAGLAYTSGGWRLFIVPAGYLGVALFGAALIILSVRRRASRTTLQGIGVLLLLLTLLYATPSIISRHWFSGLVTLFSGAGFGILLIWVGRRASSSLALLVLDMLAIQAILTSFSDLLTLIGVSSSIYNMPANDAQSMAALTLIPAMVWAVVWAAVAVLLVAGAIWLSWLRPRRRS